MDNFIAFFNDNEGFFSALLSFLAIVISVLTYRSQQKEQTKNNQENIKFQQEMAEKQNQFQADFQKRQIKLDLFKEKFECYYVLFNLVLLRDRVIHNILSYYNNIPNKLKNNYYKNKDNILKALNFASKNLCSFEKMLENLQKLALFFPEENQKELVDLYIYFDEITIRYITLEANQSNLNENDFEQIITELYKLYNSLEPLGTKYLPKLEKELNLHGIEDIK